MAAEPPNGLVALFADPNTAPAATPLAMERNAARIAVGEVSVLDTQTVERVVLIRNDGQTGQTVQRFYNPCGCLTAAVIAPVAATGATTGVPPASQTAPPTLPFRLEAGQQIAIRLKLQLSLLTPGTFRKSLAVYTEEVGAGPALILNLDGTLRPAVTFDIDALTFGKFGKDGKAAASLTLTVRPDPRLLSLITKTDTFPALCTRTNIGAIGSDLVVTGPKVVRSAAQTVLRYQIALPPDAPLGPVLGLLSFAPSAERAITHPQEALAWQQAMLPITGMVRGDVTASPQILVFTAPRSAPDAGTSGSAGVQTRWVRLTPRTATALNGARLVVTGSGVEARLAEQPDGAPPLPVAATGTDAADRWIQVTLTPSKLVSIDTSPAPTRTASVEVRLKNRQRLVLPISIVRQ